MRKIALLLCLVLTLAMLTGCGSKTTEQAAPAVQQKKEQAHQQRGDEPQNQTFFPGIHPHNEASQQQSHSLDEYGQLIQMQIAQGAYVYDQRQKQGEQQHAQKGCSQADADRLDLIPTDVFISHGFHLVFVLSYLRKPGFRPMWERT